MDYVNYGYENRRLAIEQLLERVPEIHEMADIKAEQFTNVSSYDLTPAHWLSLAQRINAISGSDSEAAGVVITHGTATVEETAYFLNLTVKSERPVVLTGALRPPSALDTDADLNLLHAVRVAGAPQAASRGVLVVLNNQIHSARDVSKSNSYRVDAFRSGDLGCLGYADTDGEIVFYRTATRKHTVHTEFDVSSLSALPRVDIAYPYVGADGASVDAFVAAGAAGIVVAGLGSGNMPSAFQAAVVRAQAAGVRIAVGTQTGSGRVVRKLSFRERDWIAADDLSSKKARVLLMLGLTRTRAIDELQRQMLTY